MWSAKPCSIYMQGMNYEFWLENPHPHHPQTPQLRPSRTITSNHTTLIPLCYCRYSFLRGKNNKTVVVPPTKSYHPKIAEYHNKKPMIFRLNIGKQITFAGNIFRPIFFVTTMRCVIRLFCIPLALQNVLEKSKVSNCDWKYKTHCELTKARE